TSRVIDADIAQGGWRRGASHDRRVNVLRAEQRAVAHVPVWLVRKVVRPRVCGIRRARGADTPAVCAVDGDADVVGVRLCTLRAPGWSCLRRVRVIPLGRARAERLAHVTVRTRSDVLELDVGRRNAAEIAACPSEGNSGCGRGLL